MTLNDRISVLKDVLKRQEDPFIRAALEKLEDAKKFWLQPGKQAMALRLEEEADKLLDMGGKHG